MMMENATGLVLHLEDCLENLLCTSIYMLFGGPNGINHLCKHELLKFCYPHVTIIFSPKPAVVMSGAGRREVASAKESMPWLEGKWLLDIVHPLV